MPYEKGRQLRIPQRASARRGHEGAAGYTSCVLAVVLALPACRLLTIQGASELGRASFAAAGETSWVMPTQAAVWGAVAIPPPTPSSPFLWLFILSLAALVAGMNQRRMILLSRIGSRYGP